MQSTFTMFNEGMSVAEIAVQRSLAPSTIETHLAAFVTTGLLDITKIIPKDRLKKIQEAIKMSGQTSALKPIKDVLPEEYSYGEIRMAMEHYRTVNG